MDLGTLTASLLVDTSALDQAKMEFLKFEKASTTSMLAVQAKLDTVSKNFRSFGMYTSMYITAPLALAGGAAFKMSKDFETSMQEIVGLVGMSQKQVDEWSSQIIEMAPKLGRSPKELADALYFVTSSGFKSAEAMDIVIQSAKGASAGLGDTKKIADLATSAMNAYKDSALSAANVMDILTAAVREGKGEAAQFASEMGEVIPVAARMGVSFAEIASGMSAMTLTGSTVEETATYMRQILVSLLDATPKAENALQQMGTSSANLRKEIRDKGLLSALSTLNDLTNKYGEDMMGKVFGNIRALTGVLSLMGDRLDENRELFKVVADSAGDMNASFEVAAKTMSFRYNQAIAAGESAMISFGKSMKGVIEPILGAIVLRLQNLVVWWNSLNTQTQQSIIKFAGFLAIIGPLALTISAVAKAFSFLVMVGTKVIKFFTAFKLAVLSNPLLAGGILLGVLTAYAIYLVAVGDSAKEAADNHKEFNDEVLRGRKLMEDVSPIQKRMAVLHTLSKSQVQDLKTSIEQQLQMEKEFTTDLVAELKSRLDADTTLKGLYKDLQNENQAVLKAGLLRQIQLRKEELATELEMENQSSQARVKQLESFLKTVDQKLKMVSSVGDTTVISEMQRALVDIYTSMQDGVQFVQRMAETQKQLGVAFDANAELMKVYEKALEAYLKLVDVSNPSVQKLVQQIQRLNDVISTPKQIQLKTAFVTPSKMPENPMLKFMKQRTEALNVPNKNLIGGALQKDLADIAMKNAMMAESFEYGGRIAQDYSDQITYLKNQLGMLWEEGYRPGQEMSDKSLQTMGDMYSARLKELQQISQLQSAYAALGMQIMQSLMMGARSWEDYGQVVIDTVRQIITAKAAEAMAVAIADAIGDAAQTGPLSWLMIPLFVGAAVGAVNTALDQIPRLKEGGVVPPGYPNDSYPAMLTSGEMVTPPGKLPMDVGNRSVMLEGDLRFEIEDTKLVAILNKRNARVRLT